MSAEVNTYVRSMQYMPTLRPVTEYLGAISADDVTQYPEAETTMRQAIYGESANIGLSDALAAATQARQHPLYDVNPTYHAAYVDLRHAAAASIVPNMVEGDRIPVMHYAPVIGAALDTMVAVKPGFQAYHLAGSNIGQLLDGLWQRYANGSPDTAGMYRAANAYYALRPGAKAERLLAIAALTNAQSQIRRGEFERFKAARFAPSSGHDQSCCT